MSEVQSRISNNSVASFNRLPDIEKSMRMRFERNGTTGHRKKGNIRSVPSRRHFDAQDDKFSVTSSTSGRMGGKKNGNVVYKPRPNDIQNIQARASKTPSWFKGSIANDENQGMSQLWEKVDRVSTANSSVIQAGLFPKTNSYNRLSCESPGSDVTFHRSVSTLGCNNDPDWSTLKPTGSDKPPSGVQRTLPLQTELEKHIYFMKTHKGLDQSFSKYVGAINPGQYRSGGPIGRPKEAHVPLTMKNQRARYGNDVIMQKEPQSQQLQQQQANTDKMLDKVKALIK